MPASFPTAAAGCIALAPRGFGFLGFLYTNLDVGVSWPITAFGDYGLPHTDQGNVKVCLVINRRWQLVVRHLITVLHVVIRMGDNDVGVGPNHSKQVYSISVYDHYDHKR